MSNPNWYKLYTAEVRYKQLLENEIIGLNAQLKAYEQLASKGIYYSLEEMAEHDALVALKAFQIMQQAAAEPQFNIDPQYHQAFFEYLLVKVKQAFNYGTTV